jgi:hypothetical protein
MWLGTKTAAIKMHFSQPIAECESSNCTTANGSNTHPCTSNTTTMLAVTGTAGSPSMPPRVRRPPPHMRRYFLLPSGASGEFRQCQPQLSHCSATHRSYKLHTSHRVPPCSFSSRHHARQPGSEWTPGKAESEKQTSLAHGQSIKVVPSKSRLDQLPAQVLTWGCSTQADRQARE